MKYLVTFRKRYSAEGEPSDDPKSLIDPGDGVIEDAEFIELVPPAGLDDSEPVDQGANSDEFENDGPLAFGTESWIYTIADGHEREFVDALKESRVVLTFEEVLDESLST